MRKHGSIVVLLCVALCGAGALGCLSGTAYGFGGLGPTPPEKKADPAMQLQEAMNLETGGGDVAPALDIYRQIVKDANKIRPFAAKALLHTAMILEHQGKKDEAATAYKALVDGYSDMPETSDARERLQVLGAGETAEEKDLKALQDKLDKRLDKVDLADATLQEVVGHLKVVGDVNVVLGPGLAKKYETAPFVDRKANLSLSGVTVGQFTNLAVESFGLDWTTWSGAIYIAEPGDVQGVRFKKQHTDLAFSPSIGDLQAQVAKLQAQNAELRKQLKEFGAYYISRPEAGPDLGQLVAPVPASREALRTAREEERRKRAEDAQDAMLANRLRSAPPAAPKRDFEATLYSARLKEFVGPQVIDLDARKVLAISPAADVTEFFQKHPEFDLAYLGESSFVANKGTRAALAPADDVPENLPQPIEYPSPRSAKAAVANITSGMMTYDHDPGVYMDESTGHIVISTQGPFVLKTDKGEYLVRLAGSVDSGLRISYQTLKPASAVLPAGARVITLPGGRTAVEIDESEGEKTDTEATEKTE